MDAAQNATEEINRALARRDKIMSALTAAAEMFLRGSLSTWQDNVLEVIEALGQTLGVKRIFLCKHKDVTATYVVTSLRYEWLAEGGVKRVDVPGYQDMHLQLLGLSRWAGVLYRGEVISESGDSLPEGERASFLSPGLSTLIVVPVFVEQEWWGFIGFEDYLCEEACSPAELDAFKTVAVTFGAAIRRKRMEESLEKEKGEVMEKVKQIGDIARFPGEDPFPVLRVSGEGTLTYANRAAEPLLDLWQTDVGQLVPKDWQERARSVLLKMRREAEDVTLNNRVYSIQAVPVLEGGYINLYGHDVTRERELDTLKSDFIAMASHELRTPLTSLRWYSERLLKKAQGLGVKEQEMLKVIHTSATQLAELVDDLLNLSRIERGKMEPELVEADLKAVVQSAAAEMKGQLTMKQITLTETYAPMQPFRLDADWVRRIVMNLLSNALKYTPAKGKVAIETKLLEGSVEVSVADTGIGIPKEDEEKVFGRFYRSEAAKASGVEGTGLGLNLVKTMVEKMGGKIWFVSEQAKGSTFTFSLVYNHKNVV